MSRTKKEVLTALNLQNALWETLQGIKSGSVDAKNANAIAKQSAEICRIQKAQIDAAKLTGKMTKAEAKRLMLK